MNQNRSRFANWTHGKASTYRHGCRCLPCKMAMTEDNKKRDRRSARLPVEPLARLTDEHFKIKHQTIFDKSRTQGLTIYQADRLCCEAGLHPWLVYGDLWFKDIWEKDEQAETKRNKG